MFAVEVYAAVRHFVFVEGNSRREAARYWGCRSRTTTERLMSGRWLPKVRSWRSSRSRTQRALGYPRQTEHPAVLEAMAEIVVTCREEGALLAILMRDEQIPSVLPRKGIAS
jgi:hypothetical protein